MRDDMTQGSTTGQLARLDDLDDYKVADGEPDIRGWDVKTSDGRKVGKVDSLIVDTGALKVRYLDIELDRKALKLDEDRHVMVPIGGARLDDDHDDVILGTTTAAQLLALPPYGRGSLTREHETALRQRLDTSYKGAGKGANTDYYAHPHYDTKQFYGKRGGTGDVQRMTLSEEELKVGKRQKRAGEVDVRKTVETQHVSEKVPLMHEEVTVERHAVSSGTTDAGRISERDISEDEIRIPVMAEEAVVEKRVVPKEEIVINKRMVQGEETVEADLKRERVDVDRDVTRTADRAAGSTGQKAKGAADRMADKADDMKDRMDGNPASRPGRDVTDRPGR